MPATPLERLHYLSREGTKSGADRPRHAVPSGPTASRSSREAVHSGSSTPLHYVRLVAALLLWLPHQASLAPGRVRLACEGGPRRGLALSIANEKHHPHPHSGDAA